MTISITNLSTIGAPNTSDRRNRSTELGHAIPNYLTERKARTLPPVVRIEESATPTILDRRVSRSVSVSVPKCLPKRRKYPQSPNRHIAHSSRTSCDKTIRGTAVPSVGLNSTTAHAEVCIRFFFANESGLLRRTPTAGWSGRESPQPSDSSRRSEAQPQEKYFR